MRQVGVLFALLGLLCANRPAAVAGQSTEAPDLAGWALTVNGPISPDELGETTMHEHLFIDFVPPGQDPKRWALSGRRLPATASEVAFWNHPVAFDILGKLQWQWDMNRDNLMLTDEATAIAEISEFKKWGGDTVVDVTSIGLKRDPQALRRVANASGLNIVMGGSWYTNTWHPEDMDSRTVEDLADEIVRDVTVGVGDTGIRTGIIGEVGADYYPGRPLTANQVKVIRASGRASRRTGAAVSLHSGLVPGAPPQALDLLEQEGADLERVIVGHAHYYAGEVDFIKHHLQRGVYIQFDILGLAGTVWEEIDDRQVAETIIELFRAGYGDRILLAHDVCEKIQLKRYGGNGFSYMLEQFVPYLRQQGVSEEQIETMLVTNPRRALTFVAPRG